MCLRPGRVGMCSTPRMHATVGHEVRYSKASTCASVRDAWECGHFTCMCKCMCAVGVNMRPMCASVQDAWECVELRISLRVWDTCEVQQGQYVCLRPGRVGMCSTHLYACCMSQSEGQYVRLRPGCVGICSTHFVCMLCESK